jgi:hypothetical protein
MNLDRSLVVERTGELYLSANYGINLVCGHINALLIAEFNYSQFYPGLAKVKE